MEAAVRSRWVFVLPCMCVRVGVYVHAHGVQARMCVCLGQLWRGVAWKLCKHQRGNVICPRSSKSKTLPRQLPLLPGQYTHTHTIHTQTHTLHTHTHTLCRAWPIVIFKIKMWNKSLWISESTNIATGREKETELDRKKRMWSMLGSVVKKREDKKRYEGRGERACRCRKCGRQL